QDPFVCQYEEQDEFKQLLAALQQIGLRSLHDDQPVPAGMVVEAINTVANSARHLDSRSQDWLRLRGFKSIKVEEVPLPWVEVMCIGVLRTMMLASAELHYFTVGRNAGEAVIDMALSNVRRSPT